MGKSPQHKLLTAVIISSLHLRREEFRASRGEIPLAVFEGNSGWIFWVPKTIADINSYLTRTNPQDREDLDATWLSLKDIIIWARFSGYDWVNIERNGEKIEGLPVY
jgi:hypothetical protein